MRFGAAFLPAMDPRDVAYLARLAEDLGYEDLWVPDQSFQHDPFVLLSGCAHVTTRIRLGVAVTNPVSRHPVQLARAAATLDQVADGRFVLGLGAGNRTRVLPSLGLPTERAAARIDEAIEVCRELLMGGQVSRRSRTLSLTDLRLEMDPRPVPIYVGTRGTRVMRLAGAKADGVLLEAMFTPEGVDYAIGEVHGGARRAGRDPREVELVAWQALKLSTALGSADVQRFRDWAAQIIRGTSEEVLERIGIPSVVAHSCRSRSSVPGKEATSDHVPDSLVERVVLTGDPDRVEDQLRMLDERGIDSVAILVFGNTEVVTDGLRRFALDVMARFG
jgi:5,10-methylenetetrahydromethanopterin reductase